MGSILRAQLHHIQLSESNQVDHHCNMSVPYEGCDTEFQTDDSPCIGVRWGYAPLLEGGFRFKWRQLFLWDCDDSDGFITLWNCCHAHSDLHARVEIEPLCLDHLHVHCESSCS